MRPTFITLVTARNSGASHLNRVELQNGCLALAHANLFIPSNLSGSCFSPETGKIDFERLKQNMDDATDIYISRANGAPCGDTQIQLFKGADSSRNQDLRPDILIYLKGSKAQKQQLMEEKPERWASIEQVWDIRNRHMKTGLPSQYVFYLKCCFAKNCSHPLCQHSGDLELPSTWFPGGPSLDCGLLPIPDPSYPWGGTNCSKCKEKICYGHFLKPEEALMSRVTPMKPPSLILREAYEELKGKDPSDTFIEEMAKATLLPPEEVGFWFDHLKTIRENRKRGAQKAAQTRRQKKASNRYFCSCGDEYLSITDEIEQWIGCDNCDSWFHCECVGVNPHSIPDSFVCSKCK